jgi:hypothetical protein
MNELCKKTYYSTIGDQDVIVWCPNARNHDGECGPFWHAHGDDRS